jgi:hypothetical protein
MILTARGEQLTLALECGADFARVGVRSAQYASVGVTFPITSTKSDCTPVIARRLMGSLHGLPEWPWSQVMDIFRFEYTKFTMFSPLGFRLIRKRCFLWSCAWFARAR